MTTVRSFRRNAGPTTFEAFVALIREQIRPHNVEAFQEGIREMETATGPANLALDPARQFVAARWTTRKNGFVDHVEACFVVPANKPAQIGIRTWSTSEEQEAGDDAPAWWSALGDQSTPISRSGAPSFTELACLLASGGGTLTQSEGLAERLGSLSSEVAYLQGLLIDHRDELRRTKAALRQARLGAFSPLLASSSVEPEVDQAPVDLSELPEWCADHEDEIVVLPRALNGAKKSQYEDPAMIYTALDILAGPYRQHRMGQMTRAQFDEILLPTGLRFAASVGTSIAGEQGDAYFVNWGGRRRFLESHLLKGGGREERYCLRVYFFWDADSARVVCGSLPAHLANSLT
jgi:hypothetical protein